MGFMDWLRASEPVSDGSPKTFHSLSELENAGYEVIDVGDDGVVYASERGVATLQDPTASGFNGAVDLTRLREDSEGDLTPNEAVGDEISASGDSVWRRARLTDYNPELSGTRAIDKYREMKNDALVRSSLRIAKMPILSARWFMEPASQDQADLERSDFVWDNLTKWMSHSWPQFLVETLYMMDYGAYVFEKVFEQREWRGEQRIYWRKFAPRHPYDIDEFIYDEHGGPEAIRIITDTGDVELPINKALIFTFDKEGGDLWGHSLLRSVYKHWFYKEQLYKIDAIQKERHGIGIPVVILPPNFDHKGKAERNKQIAENIGMNLRTNESAHVVLPPNWEVHFLKLEGQRVDALESAQHHAEKLYEGVLANFLSTRMSERNSEIQEHVFTRSVRFTAEIIRDTLNKYAIPQLIRLNWPEEELEEGYPQLKVRRLGDERDWRTISFAIRNLVGAKVVRPDDDLEEWVREEMDMPVADPSTMRDIDGEDGEGVEGPESDDPEEQANRRAATGGTPRNPNIGTGRQSNTPSNNAGSSRVGRDASGG